MSILAAMGYRILVSDRLVPCAVTICVVIVGLVPCAAQEIERFSEDTRNKVCMPRLGHKVQILAEFQLDFCEMAKSQGITVSPPAQQQGSKNVQTGRPQNILTLSLTKGNTTYDEFKHGFPSDGLSTASNKWWGSNSPDGYESIHGEGAETDEDKKHQSEKIGSLEEGQKALKLGVLRGYGEARQKGEGIASPNILSSIVV
ncbi:unnamed protein product [Prunus armeniaca]|uniref:Uncharacterized protein n=2 Tax=Prunus armeniaca TaxID=36596 RepID=A0A6J5TTY5_PRUAR|nr:unnamed protein product [Prunus armeniaca]